MRVRRRGLTSAAQWRSCAPRRFSTPAPAWEVDCAAFDPAASNAAERKHVLER